MQLRVEELEPRVLLSTLTWTGAFDANWNDGTVGVSTNWSGNAKPNTGDTLIFAAGAAHLTNVNNTAANNNYLLQFTGGAYIISGNAIDVTGAGLSDSSSSAVSLADNLLLTGPLTASVSGAGPLTLSGVLSESVAGTGLTKTGAGTLTLSNAANTYTGMTTISAGTLQVGAANAVPSASSVTDNATLDLHGFNDAIAALNGTGSVTSSVAGTATLTVGGGGSFSGVLQNGSGTVALTVAGSAQTLTLSGTNTYTGLTTVNSGDTLKAGSTTAFSAGSSVSAVGTLDLAGFSNSIGALNGSGTATNSVESTVYQIDNGNAQVGYNNTLFSEAEDNWVGNVFTAVVGNTQLSSISFQTSSALNATTLPSPFITAALYSGAPGAGLTLVPGSVNTVALNAAAGQLVTVPFAAPQNVSVGQVFTAALLIDNVPNTTFPFELDNSGSNANSYYDISSPSGNVNTYNLAAPNGPTLNGVNYGSTGSSNTPGYLDRTLLRVNKISAALTVTGGGTFSGTIKDGNGALNLIVNGPAQTLTLSGANTYTGTTVINGGTLLMGASTAIPSTSRVTLAVGGANLDLNGFNLTIPLVGTVGNSQTPNNSTVLLHGGKLTTGGSNLSSIFSGLVSGTNLSSINKQGTGTFYLFNGGSASSFLGAIVIGGGYVIAGADGALGAASAAGITVQAGAALTFKKQLNYTTAEPVFLNGQGVVVGTSPSYNSGALQGNYGSFAGPITLQSNSLIESTGTSGSYFTLSGSINTNGFQLAFGGHFTNTVGVSNAITGSGNVVTLGTTTTVLSGASTHQGSTTVGAGSTLTVDGSLLSTGSVSVASGGALSGNGSVGNLTVSGTVKPGDPSINAYGTLTASSANFSSGGTLAAMITGNSSSPKFNKLSLSGTLTLGGTSTLTANLSGLSYSATSGSTVNYTVVSAAAVSGTFSSTSYTNQGSSTPTVITSGTTVVVQIGNVGSSWVSDAAAVPGVQPNFAVVAPTAPSQTTVAVLDTGIDFSNSALVPNIWINQAEIPTGVRPNLVDVEHDGFISFRDLQNPINQGPGKIEDVYHDGYISVRDLLAPLTQGGWATGQVDPTDGLVDDIVGWNFVDNNNNPYDRSGHGTYSASLVTEMDRGAVIMPLQIMDSSGIGTLAEATAALNYAVAHGAGITLNAWVPDVLTPAWTSAVSNAEAQGVLMIMAAGNNDAAALDNLAQMHLSNVVIVGAADAGNRLATFSNSGAGVVDLAAAGVGVFGTVAGGHTEAHSGTSVSAALVAGDAALAWGLHPSLTDGDIVEALFAGADRASGLMGGVTDGRLLNLAGTLAVASQLDRSAIQASGQTPLAGADATTLALTTGLHGTVLTKDSSPVPLVEGASLSAAWLHQAFDENAATPPATVPLPPPQNSSRSPDADAAWSATLDQVSTSWLESTLQGWQQSGSLLQSPADSGLQSWLSSCPWLGLEPQEQLPADWEEPAALG